MIPININSSVCKFLKFGCFIFSVKAIEYAKNKTIVRDKRINFPVNLTVLKNSVLFIFLIGLYLVILKNTTD